jgi:sterol desaturase/sphingolipid hydroxylase (fatty acid hydroxylase superfamily)
MIPTNNETGRIFKSPFLEAFTKTHWIAPPIVFLPVIAYFTWVSIKSPLSLVAIIGWISVGLISWTLAEYLLHRFLFHFEPKSNLGKKIHFLIHGIHHDYPQDAMRLVLPVVASCFSAILFYSIFYLILGPLYTPPFFAAFVAGYLYYDMLHYAIHHAPMKSRFGRYMKVTHMKHHYQDEQATYGVSTTIWDRLFKSTQPPLKK